MTEQYGVARRVADVVRMARDTWTGARQTSIASMAHIAESGTVTAGDAGFDNVTLVAKKVGLIYKFSNELLEDSAVSVADLAARNIVEAQANREDTDYMLGDGTEEQDLNQPGDPSRRIKEDEVDEAFGGDEKG
jgi:HK97 family phage major capsid protein